MYYSQMAHDLMQSQLPRDAAFYWLPNAIDIDYAPPANVPANDTVFLSGTAG